MDLYDREAIGTRTVEVTQTESWTVTPVVWEEK